MSSLLLYWVTSIAHFSFSQHALDSSFSHFLSMPFIPTPLFSICLRCFRHPSFPRLAHDLLGVPPFALPALDLFSVLSLGLSPVFSYAPNLLRAPLKRWTCCISPARIRRRYGHLVTVCQFCIPVSTMSLPNVQPFSSLNESRPLHYPLTATKEERDKKRDVVRKNKSVEQWA